jgi:hypothetical protein
MDPRDEAPLPTRRRIPTMMLVRGLSFVALVCYAMLLANHPLDTLSASYDRSYRWPSQLELTQPHAEVRVDVGLWGICVSNEPLMTALCEPAQTFRRLVAGYRAKQWREPTVALVLDTIVLRNADRRYFEVLGPTVYLCIFALGAAILTFLYTFDKATFVSAQGSLYFLVLLEACHMVSWLSARPSLSVRISAEQIASARPAPIMWVLLAATILSLATLIADEAAALRRHRYRRSTAAAVWRALKASADECECSCFQRRRGAARGRGGAQAGCCGGLARLAGCCCRCGNGDSSGSDKELEGPSKLHARDARTHSTHEPRGRQHHTHALGFGEGRSNPAAAAAAGTHAGEPRTATRPPSNQPAQTPLVDKPVY